MPLNAKIIEAEGKPKFSVIGIEEYEALQESLASFDTLDDFLDYMHALKTKNETTSWHTLDEAKKELGL
jgi:hypothetical protein